MPGQEGVPAICAPMARTLEDLETFWKAVVSMKPWEYDHSVRTYKRALMLCLKLLVLSYTLARNHFARESSMGRDVG